ncbi:MAG: motility protein A [Deferribacteraceae bacterium]|jgi:chemotaxis protein MotA|nr:motility protein A [Deferribacteraceae bacterium]
MDIGSIIGIGLAYAMVILGMMLSATIGIYIDFPSFLIVVVGTIGIIIGAYPPKILMTSLRAGMKAFIYSPQSQAELILQLVDFAVRARRDGILSLESVEEDMKDEFLRKGIRLAVDGTEPATIQAILEADLENMAGRHSENVAMYGSATDLAPAMGMVGTLIGLVAMLQNMDDPSAIGPAMAVALITTMYGAIIANLTTTPIATRLKIRSAEEQKSRQIMLAGIMSIQAGDNPRVVEQKLNAFLPPSLRKSQFD